MASLALQPNRSNETKLSPRARVVHSTSLPHTPANPSGNQSCVATAPSSSRFVNPSREPCQLRKSIGVVRAVSCCASPAVLGSPRVNQAVRSTSGSMRHSVPIAKNDLVLDANAVVIASTSRPSGKDVVGSPRTSSARKASSSPSRPIVSASPCSTLLRSLARVLPPNPDYSGSLTIKRPPSPQVATIEFARSERVPLKSEVGIADIDLASCKTTPEAEIQLGGTMSLIHATTTSEMQRFVSVLKDELRHEVAEYVKVEIQQAVRQEMRSLPEVRKASMESYELVDRGSKIVDAPEEQEFVTTSAMAELSERIENLKHYCEGRLLTIEETFRGEFMPALATIVDKCGSLEKQVHSAEVEYIDRSNRPIPEEPEQTGDSTLALRQVTGKVLASTRSDLLATMKDIATSATQDLDQKLQCVIELLPATQESAKSFIQKELHVLRELQKEELSEHRSVVSQLGVKVNHFQRDLELVLGQIATHRQILESVCALVKKPLTNEDPSKARQVTSPVPTSELS